nr:protein SPIRRIG isoform X1 [Ipomoea batatas]
MFQKSPGRTMKWATLLKDFKEKVGLSHSSSAVSSSSISSSSSFRESYASPVNQDFIFSPSSCKYECDISRAFVFRGKRELELDFRRYWEEFHSSSSEKEKEKALIMTVDAFCKLVKNQADVAQLITK